MKAVETREILDKALELENGNELYYDLKRQRLWLIEDNLPKYEQVIIDRNTFDLHPNVILRKRSIVSAYIKKTDGRKTNITF